MDKFTIVPEIAKLLPKMQIVIVVAKNIEQAGTAAKVTPWADETVNKTIDDLASYANAQSHPRVAIYRDVLKEKCNFSLKKYPQSNEALYKRIMKEKHPLNPINPVVDFYNAVSIKHGVPVGAFDLDDIKSRSSEPMLLQMSKGGEKYTPIGGDPDKDATEIAAGELTYTVGPIVLNRYLAWRQAQEGCCTEASKNVMFLSEIFNPDVEQGKATELSQAVATDLADGLEKFFGAKSDITYLGESMEKLTVELP